MLFEKKILNIQDKIEILQFLVQKNIKTTHYFSLIFKYCNLYD